MALRHAAVFRNPGSYVASPASSSATLIWRRSTARIVPSWMGSSYCLPVRLSVTDRVLFDTRIVLGNGWGKITSRAVELHRLPPPSTALYFGSHMTKTAAPRPDRGDHRRPGDLSVAGARGRQGSRAAGRDADRDRDAGRDPGRGRPDRRPALRLRVPEHRDGCPGAPGTLRGCRRRDARAAAEHHDRPPGGVVSRCRLAGASELEHVVHVRAHRAGHALHLRVLRVDHLVLVRRVRPAAVAEPEMARGEP